MSTFGQRMAPVNAIVDAEMADDFLYWPHKEVVGAEPIPDPDRTVGTVSVIILQPGIMLGMGYSLASMMQRTSSDITMWYMARGLLGNAEQGTSVRKFDRFLIAAGMTNPDRQYAYEVAGGPKQVGFGRWKVTMIEIDWPDEPPELPAAPSLMMNPLNVMSPQEIKKRIIARGLNITVQEG